MSSNSRSKAFDVSAVRARTGLNQSDFWAKVHVTQSGGSRYEGGRRMHPTVRALVGYVYLGEQIKRHRSS